MLKYETTYNHTQLFTFTHNHPQPFITTNNQYQPPTGRLFEKLSLPNNVSISSNGNIY